MNLDFIFKNWTWTKGQKLESVNFHEDDNTKVVLRFKKQLNEEVQEVKVLDTYNLLDIEKIYYKFFWEKKINVYWTRRTYTQICMFNLVTKIHKIQPLELIVDSNPYKTKIFNFVNNRRNENNND